MSEIERPLQKGDHVVKVKGYPFNGKIISVMEKLDGESIRYVVENVEPFPGLCLILSGDQLRRTDDR